MRLFIAVFSAVPVQAEYILDLNCNTSEVDAFDCNVKSLKPFEANVVYVFFGQNIFGSTNLMVAKRKNHKE